MAKEKYKDYFRFDETASDDELVRQKDKWLASSMPYHDWILLYQNKSLAYYNGDQTLKNEISPYNSDTVYNRIFEGTETIVPIVTGTAHQFVCIPGAENEVSVQNARALQEVLQRKFIDLDMQKKNEVAVRDMILKRYAVFEYGWDIENDDIGVWNVDPRNVVVPRMKCDANELPYVMVMEEYTSEDMEEHFPGVDLTKLSKGKAPAQIQTTNYTPVGVINILRPTEDLYLILKVVTDNYWVWMQNDVVIRREKNLYWDYDGEDEKVAYTRPSGKVVHKKFKRFYNFLDRPRKPYVFMTPFTTGDSPIADSSLAEIAIPIQDDINVQKRQIANNLVKLGNGQIYIDSDSLTDEVIEQISSEPGLILVGKGLASENRIRREAGVPLPTAHFNNLAASIQAFDNVFGTHGSVRGASSSETLGGAVLDRQSDLSRIDQFTRELNRGTGMLANGLVQLMKMFYDEQHVIPIIGKDKAISFLRFTRDNIDENVILEVKSGTPVMLDPVARSNRAIQLWQLGGIDPETFFEELQFANPEEMAQKLQAWKQGQLMLESQTRIQEAQAGVQAKAAADMATAGEERGAETQNDSVSRATQDVGSRGKVDLAGVLKTANT